MNRFKLLARLKPLFIRANKAIVTIGAISTAVALLTITIHSAQASYDLYDQLPDLGSNAENFLSKHDAQQLGKAFIRSSRYQVDYIYDPELLDYINQLGNRLVKASDTPDENYQFYLINNNVINAFAVPGGHVALHSAILTKSQTESELASVVAHEISHISQHHIERKLEASRYDSFIALGAMLAAVAAGGSEGAQAAFGLSQATILSRQLSYSRSFEAEADSLGLRLLSKAGYDPQAMPVFFKRLLNENRLNDANGLEFLRSHPLTLSRITETTQRANAYPAGNAADEEKFQLMQAKALAQYAYSPERAVKYFNDKLRLGQDTQANRYGYALALSKNTQYDQARKEINKLRKDYPNNVSIRLIQADNEIEARNVMQGLDLMATLYEEQHAKGNELIDLYYANALVLTGQHDLAIPLLRKIVKSDNEEPYFHILLARAYGETGELQQSFISRGEYHYLQGNYQFALKQFERALKGADSNYNKARLQARIDDCKAMINSLKNL